MCATFVDVNFDCRKFEFCQTFHGLIKRQVGETFGTHTNKQDDLLLKEAKNISKHSFLENVKVAIHTENWQRRTVTRKIRFVLHFGAKKAKPTICRLLSELER